jgi:sortase A
VNPRRRAFTRVLALGLLAGGGACLAWGLYIPAKAMLAQILLERAWNETRNGKPEARPWPWADITPIAELEVPRLHERAIVLEGASGSAMAFGPGHMPNTAAIGARGTAVVAAHRDTQFRFLKDILPGDIVITVTPDGQRTEFRVAERRVVKADASGLDPQDEGPHGARLALVTCYPFDGLFHSPLRYVVIADRAAGVTPPAAASSGTR